MGGGMKRASADNKKKKPVDSITYFPAPPGFPAFFFANYAWPGQIRGSN